MAEQVALKLATLRNLQCAKETHRRCPTHEQVMLVSMDTQRDDIVWQCPWCPYEERLSRFSACTLIKDLKLPFDLES